MKTPTTLAISLVELSLAAFITGCGGGSKTIVLPPPSITVTLVSVPPTVPAGQMAQLSAHVANDASAKGVTWTLTQSGASCSPGCGTIPPNATASDAPVTFTAPSAVPSNHAVTLTATSVADTSKSATASITITPPPPLTVSIAPNPATAVINTSQPFAADVQNDPENKGVTWTLTQGGVACSPGCGTITPNSTPSDTPITYSAPAAVPSNPDVILTATSVTDTTVSATATVTITFPPIAVSISPDSVLLPLNLTQQFTATVQDDPANKGVNWSLAQNGAACTSTCGIVAPGSTASGTPTTFTAPAAVPGDGSVNLVATSMSDSTVSPSVIITVTSGTVKLLPKNLNFGVVKVGVGVTKHVTLTNTGNTALTVTSVTVQVAGFTEQNTCGTSVPAGSTCDIAVKFLPTRTNLFVGTLSIADSSSDGTQTISLRGKGTNTPIPMVAALAKQLTPVASPGPSGPFRVGTRVMGLLDPTRDDPFLANGIKRELLVRFWYPAPSDQTCHPAEYTSQDTWSYFSKLLAAPLPDVTTNSCSDAPITAGVHPIVVFTHGYTGTFTDYTFLFEDLASRGYLVASLDHTYEATAVAFPGGQFAESVLGSHLAGTVRGDDHSLALALSVRLRDLNFVMNELARLNASRTSPFPGAMDLSNVALAGHSFGGLVALLGAERDKRFKAAAVIDNIVPAGLINPTSKPVLLLAAGRKEWTEEENHLWNELHGPRLAVNLVGAEHLTPTDAVWLAPGAIQTGDMGPERTIAAIRNYVAAFLDENLRGKRGSPLLSGQFAEYPEVTVTTRSQALHAQP